MSKICKDWHEQPLVNPVTNRIIKKNGPTYRELEKKCGPPMTRRSSPRRSSPRRSSPRRSSPRRSSPRRSSPRRSSPIRRNPETYCGNNAKDEGLTNGTKVLGNRFQCLRKGIGRGLNEPIFTYSEEYEPIENIKVYCGNNANLPRDKDRFGTRDECLRKGFAVGQKQKYSRDGGVQKEPIITQDRGWYKVYVPRST
ncbi:Serine/threonine protein kinase [Armadillidium vulgare iridescent virus]|uniref:Serine/threonine protein kinase n=1 Tax=Armadillidium vulgare iridescent virus TaxID=72201 RepID=A0A068QL52_9VIRU|nr:Serine/threonine protein kinase [Armadillidium vulgare iridescent virus]CCV02510.1 Serine/threonine protein kinase [Armadillidium vulgare iridescent virus]